MNVFVYDIPLSSVLTPDDYLLVVAARSQDGAVKRECPADLPYCIFMPAKKILAWILPYISSSTNTWNLITLSNLRHERKFGRHFRLSWLGISWWVGQMNKSPTTSRNDRTSRHAAQDKIPWNGKHRWQVFFCPYICQTYYEIRMSRINSG